MTSIMSELAPSSLQPVASPIFGSSTETIYIYIYIYIYTEHQTPALDALQRHSISWERGSLRDLIGEDARHEVVATAHVVVHVVDTPAYFVCLCSFCLFCSFCCWVAWPRLAETERFFTDAGRTKRVPTFCISMHSGSGLGKARVGRLQRGPSEDFRPEWSTANAPLICIHMFI